MSRADYSPTERRRIDAAREELAERFPAEAALISQAVELAARHHAGQRRKSGEPFVFHPLEVARILARDGLGHETVIAALCHDLIEDTDCTRAELERNFGAAVAAIVEGVTKVSRSAAKLSPSERKAGTYQKLILAAASDARVLPVKLADRLHNLRTIAALRRDRQQAIARETLLIYAPLAHRLGMSRIRTELEDRSLAITDPAAYAEASAIQAEHRSRAERELGALRGELEKALEEAGLSAEISARVKSRYSIAEKLKRAEPDELADVLGLRVIVETTEQCYLALGAIHALWPPKPGTFDDYIATPRANLYQSLHTTVIAHGATVEVQIRTREMDEIAEYGIAAHWRYKETLRGGGPRTTRRFLELAAEGQRPSGEGEQAVAAAYEALRRELFAEDLVCFTPRGDVKLLPEGACAIDFAYAIHSELGDRITGARVDGRLYPITKALPQGAVVEIVASDDGEPSVDWLEAVKTNRARSRIRAHHQADLEREQAEAGRELLVRELRRAGLAPMARPEILEEALAGLGHREPEEVMRAVAADHSQLRYVVRRLIREVAPRSQAPGSVPETGLPRPRAREGAVLVEGQQGIPTRLAGCCHPEPGDEITGFVSMGRGVSVHRSDCPNITGLRGERRERLIGVQWAGEDRTFQVALDLAYLNRPGLLHRIAEAVYGAGAELVALELRERSGGIVAGRCQLRVAGSQQSDRARGRLAGIDGAMRVARAASGS